MICIDMIGLSFASEINGAINVEYVGGFGNYESNFTGWNT